jgi:molybdate transport system substrate-binding protein
VTGRWLAAIPAAIALLATSCGGSGATGTPRPAAVTVFAASSLTNAFAAEKTAYLMQHNGSITMSFAGSQALVAQIENGAPADVVATADATTIAALGKRLIAAPTVFAHNRLVIVTAPGNPKHVRSLADMARAGVVTVLAAPSVPAGKYAARAFADAHVAVHPRSLELDVRSVLTKVELGEADAGIVYATDAESARGKVGVTALPDAPVATYEIGALDATGEAFVRYVLSAGGQAVLDRFGFLPP